MKNAENDMRNAVKGNHINVHISFDSDPKKGFIADASNAWAENATRCSCVKQRATADREKKEPTMRAHTAQTTVQPGVPTVKKINEK
jgi:hypothetical protein